MNDKKFGLATVGLVTIKKNIINSNEFKAGKKGDNKAASKIIQQVWSEKKTSMLKENLTENSILLTVPSTTRINVIPSELASYLSDKLKIPWVNADDIFNVEHKTASKNISRDKRVFAKREYAVTKNIDTKTLQNKDIILIDDILTSGSTIRNYSQFLKEKELNVTHVVGLMGDRRLDIDQKTEEKLSALLQRKNIGVAFKSINHITRTEAGGLIRLLNNARSPNAISKITEAIQGLSRQGSFKDIGRTSRNVWNQGPKGSNIGNVRPRKGIQNDSSTSTEWAIEFLQDGKTIKKEKVVLPAGMTKEEQLKELHQKARSIVIKLKAGTLQIKTKLLSKNKRIESEKNLKKDQGR